ncbi:MAG: sulfotransferase domain-containing protein [Thermococcus sp.]|uniref:sulfotransferase domain-containing protein n=1 Tax=Thermococcus sp. TaxID=35749 RepID=UPI001E10F9F3|nr:sulfotransferase domain-containing protein [Thermococcus sp.]MBO8175040.1 sulfotransferase domain-containing protein [Thermococcus sp.]
MLPNFLICGTQKGGTTALYHYLKEHPQVFMPKWKELHFFDQKLDRGLEWYEKQFQDAPESARAIGEATPEYMYFEWIPEKIHELIPDVKLIFILRNPVDRAYSHYWHEIKLCYETLSFEEAIEMEEERLSSGDFYNRLHYSYKDRGKYIEQLKRFRRYFSKDQMLVLLNDELKSNPVGTMRTVFEFLEIDPNFISPSWNRMTHVGLRPRFWLLQRSIASLPPHLIDAMMEIVKYQPIKGIIQKVAYKPGYPPMNPETREKLLKYFKPYNQKLEKFLEASLPENWYR